MGSRPGPGRMVTSCSGTNVGSGRHARVRSPAHVTRSAVIASLTTRAASVQGESQGPPSDVCSQHRSEGHAYSAEIWAGGLRLICAESVTEAAFTKAEPLWNPFPPPACACRFQGSSGRLPVKWKTRRSDGRLRLRPLLPAFRDSRCLVSKYPAPLDRGRIVDPHRLPDQVSTLLQHRGGICCSRTYSMRYLR